MCKFFLLSAHLFTEQGHILSLMAAVSCQRLERFIRNDYEGPNPDGSYRWALQTEGGIFHEQVGSFRSIPAAAEPALLVEGQYQYTAPNGRVIRVIYRADENGFRPMLF